MGSTKENMMILDPNVGCPLDEASCFASTVYSPN